MISDLAPACGRTEIITLRPRRRFRAVVGSSSRDRTHGVVEREAEDLDVEVDGVAGQVSCGPAPVGVFDDEAGIGGQNKIARLAWDDLESAF